MKGSKRGGAVLVGLGLATLVGSAAIVWDEPQAHYGNLDKFLVAIGLAMFAGCLLLVGAILFCRELMGMGGDDDWSDWGK